MLRNIMFTLLFISSPVLAGQQRAQFQHIPLQVYTSATTAINHTVTGKGSKDNISWAGDDSGGWHRMA